MDRGHCRLWDHSRGTEGPRRRIDGLVTLVVLCGLCLGCAEGAPGSGEDSRAAGRETGGASVPARGTKRIAARDIADAVVALGTAYDVPIEVRDERKADRPPGRPVEVRLEGDSFWGDLARLEEAHGVQVGWLGASSQNTKAIVRLADDGPRIVAGVADGRFRVTVTRSQTSAQGPPARADQQKGMVALSYLPGPRVVRAIWRTDDKQRTLVRDGSAGHGGEAILGMVGLSDGEILRGQVEVVVGVAWEEVVLPLTEGSHATWGDGSPIRRLRFVRLAGVEHAGVPRSFDLDDRGSRRCDAYSVEFEAVMPDGRIFPCAPSECCLIDASGERHVAESVGFRKLADGAERLFVTVPAWPGGAVPKSIRMRVPVRTDRTVLDLEKVTRLGYPIDGGLDLGS